MQLMRLFHVLIINLLVSVKATKHSERLRGDMMAIQTLQIDSDHHRVLQHPLPTMNSSDDEKPSSNYSTSVASFTIVKAPEGGSSTEKEEFSLSPVFYIGMAALVSVAICFCCCLSRNFKDGHREGRRQQTAKTSRKATTGNEVPV